MSVADPGPDEPEPFEPGFVLALDADVVVYSVTDVPAFAALQTLFDPRSGLRLVGSVFLLPELLTKPTRQGDSDELDVLMDRLARLELLPADEGVCMLAVTLGATHGLRAADAVHLATAVDVGADAFLTNNRKDFHADRITDVRVLHPTDLTAGERD